MNNTLKPVTESSLKTDLNELAHSLVRELSMACKKMSIYGAQHQLALKAAERPFLDLAKFFSYRPHVTINVNRGQLSVMNISMKESIFTNQILQYLQILDVTSLIFERTLATHELILFIDSLVKRDTLYDPNYSLGAHLMSRKVQTIQVNSALAFDLYDKRKQYRGEVDGDFSVKRLALDQFGVDPISLAKLRLADPADLYDLGVDYNREIVSYLLPEKVGQLQAEQLRQALVSLNDEAGNVTTSLKASRKDLFESLRALIAYHPQRMAILPETEHDGAGNIPKKQTDPCLDTGHIKIELSARVDKLIEDYFSSKATSSSVEQFSEAFYRLLKIGQRDKAEQIIDRLAGMLTVNDSGYRQKGLALLTAAIQTLSAEFDQAILESLINRICLTLKDKKETFEFSSLLTTLFERCRHLVQFDLLARLVSSMADRRQVSDGVTVYDSMTIKAAYEHINTIETIEFLVAELVKADHALSHKLRTILVGIGSEQIAFRLAQIISHPIRQVRQNALKILAELGKASLSVFSAILNDDHWFERDCLRFELPDGKWYVVRNSIFVLGSLRDHAGVTPLRLRISDTDVRVRREIVSALEKIGGEDAIDLLVLMADDTTPEIRDAAIIAVGLVGNSDSAPLLIDLFSRNSAGALKGVTVLGKLGGQEARAYLGKLLTDQAEFSRLAAGNVSKDDLRAAIIKALGAIGDNYALEAIKQYQNSLTTAQKLLFRNSAVSQAIIDVLTKR
ncbi:MAG: HEAT repeat domain-containing protein [candidate division Zixibacteria bacterium]|nr:HEAT repeat domain-containing protein [candidate division Zixibacteria bacterium]